MVNQQPEQDHNEDAKHDVGAEQELALVCYGDQLSILIVGSGVVVGGDETVTVRIFQL